MSTYEAKLKAWEDKRDRYHKVLSDKGLKIGDRIRARLHIGNNILTGPIDTVRTLEIAVNKHNFPVVKVIGDSVKLPGRKRGKKTYSLRSVVEYIKINP